VWTTTADGSVRLERTATVEAQRSSDTSTDTIEVDPDAVGQEVRGFGAALTQSSAALLLAMSDDARRALLTELFDPAGPVRLSVLRVALGGSDFVVEPAATYDDVPPGDTDWDLERFSTASDEPVRSLVRDIRALAPDLVVVGSPWSPPAWLKTSGSLEGGSLLDDDRAYATYAAYLVRTVQEYAAAGAPLDALTVQNEPQARHPDGYPGTDLPVADQVRLITTLGPALADAGLDTEILAFDHNWSLHPSDEAATPDGADPEPDYAHRCCAATRHRGSPASRSTATPATRAPRTRSTTSSRGRDLADRVLRLARPGRAAGAGVRRHADLAGAEPAGRVAAPRRDGGPDVEPRARSRRRPARRRLRHLHRRGDGRRRGGHAERRARRARARGAVRAPGSTRVGSAGPADDALTQVAFRTPAGATVVLAQHDGDADRSVDVVVDGDRFPVTLPARSLSTVVVDGAREPTFPSGALPVPVDLAGATASPGAPTDPCCTGDVAGGSIDDDPGTRWSAGRAQRPGDELVVDLREPAAVRSVVLDAGGGDWPRGYEVSVSTDGSTWSDPVAHGAGAGSVTAIGLPGDEIRSLRITLTADADPWWSVAALRVFA
jgi:glucosylceramidase